MKRHDTKIKILPLIAELQRRTGKRFNDKEYADMIGISRQAFAALLNGETGGATNKTINKLLDFFDAQGMPVTVGALYLTEVTDT
jgi:transcriptional regulator with XRE-family HTH domain